MTKSIQLYLASTIVLLTQVQSIFAVENTGLIGWSKTTKQIREWDFHLEDIAPIINSMINVFLSIAWTVAVIFVIIGAYKLLFGSLKQDHTKWRETIIMALTGFAISLLAWFIVKFIFNNFNG